MINKTMSLLVLLSISSVSIADEATKGTESTSSVSINAAVDQSRLANDLANYGEANDDALALIVAASIAKANLGGQADRVLSRGASKDKPTAADTANRMLARAKELAKDRKDLLALAADVEEQQSRGITTCWASSAYGSWYWTGPSYSVARSQARRLCRAYSPYGAYCSIDWCD